MSYNYQQQQQQAYPPEGYGQPYPPNYSYPQGQPYPQSQPYPPAPAYPDGDVHTGANTKPEPGNPEEYAGKKKERFVPTGKWQDLWALILFYIHLAGYAGMLVLTVPSINFNELDEIQFSFAEVGDVSREFIGIGVGAVASFIACIVYLMLLTHFPLAMVKISFFASIVLFVALAGLYFFLGSWVAAILFVVVAVFFLLSYRAFRARMPLVALLIKTIVDVASKWKAVYVVTFNQAVISFVHVLSFLAILLGGLQRWYQPGDSGQGGTVDGAYIGVIVYSLFSLYWTQQVIKNVGHVTLGGVFAAFYFLSPSLNNASSSTATPQGPGMPKYPTLSSFKRAMTTSFGSIAFGSLVIAAIQFIRFIIRQIVYNADGPLVFLACCLDCILGCIEGLIEFFNEYAFAQVAIYGKPYVRAAKDTWNLLKTRGFDVIIQENLTNSVLMVGGFIVAAIGVGVAFAVALAQGVNVTSTVSLIFLIAVPLIVGFVLFGVVAVVIDSGTATTFVCLAEEPDALYRTKPELYEAIRTAFPSIVVPVSGYA